MQVTIAKLIPKDSKCFTTVINDDKYYGSNFILREDLCRKALKERVEKLFYRSVSDNTFRQNKEAKYSYKEVEAETYKDGTRLIDGENYVYIQSTYYQYFKGLGYEFRFNSRVDPVGIFKGDEWVGMIIPMRIVIDGEVM